tara:strand:+ start:538 stop:1110 length:573 start_codon:yes stop_codon:yes gene_type:complete
VIYLVEIPMETIRMVEDIFQQGDSRYEDFDSALMVATFLEREAIIIKKEIITDIEVTDKEMRGVTQPQEDYKVIARRLFEERGYMFRGYEVFINGGRTDIRAINSDNNEILAIECCACRFTKVFEYLEVDNLIFWVLSQAEKDEFPVKELPLYIIARGPNWNEYFNLYKKYRLERIRGKKTPLDRLEENK